MIQLSDHILSSLVTIKESYTPLIGSDYIVLSNNLRSIISNYKVKYISVYVNGIFYEEADDYTFDNRTGVFLFNNKFGDDEKVTIIVAYMNGVSSYADSLFEETYERVKYYDNFTNITTLNLDVDKFNSFILDFTKSDEMDNIEALNSISINILNKSIFNGKTFSITLLFGIRTPAIVWDTNIIWNTTDGFPPVLNNFTTYTFVLNKITSDTKYCGTPIFNINTALVSNIYNKVDFSEWMSKQFPYTYTYMTILPHSIIEYFNNSKPINISKMFENCHELTNINVSNMDTSICTDMNTAFAYCHGFTHIDLTLWNTSACTNMRRMFRNINGVQSVDLNGFDTRNVTDMSEMFYNILGSFVLDLSSFDTRNVTNMSNMFAYNFSSQKYIILNSNEFKFEMKDSSCAGLNNNSSNWKILVPSTMISTYQNATNWSSVSSIFDSIENYTISKTNGLITVTPLS